jgi:hypothetical protein
VTFDFGPLLIVIALLGLDVLALKFGADSRRFASRERHQPSL